MTEEQIKTIAHRNAELIHACPFPVQQQTTLRVKLKSEHGETKWLSITPDEFKLIEHVLEGIITQ